MERTELYGLPRQDFLFILKNVACTPTAPRQKEVITIKGEVNLLKIPFYAPVWVIASVTYPEKWWEILGSPTVHEMTVAIGGKFEIKFAEGFDREGEYTLAVNLYFGPTITTTLGTLKSVTLPPLPSLDTYEAKFTVSGELPPEEKLYTISKPTVTPSVIVEGTKVAISVPVTSGATQQETVTVRLKVDYGSALPGPGNTIKTISSSPTVMNPGDSLTFTFNYTEVAPNDGRRDTEVDVLVNGLSKGYDHQNDLWEVLPAGGLTQGTVNFTCDSPVEIYVDFVHYGKTPISINLFTGNRNWVAIDIQGNQTAGQVNVVTGQTQNVKVTFPSGVQTGILHITFTPTNATVTVDGTPVTNGGTYQLSIGYHTWHAQLSGYYTDTAQFLILLNQTTNITILLIALPGGGAAPPYPSAEVRNVTIVSYQTQLKMGDTCNVKIRFEYQGPDQTRTLYAVIGNYGWAGFDEILSGSKAVRLSAKSSWTTYEDTVPIVVTQAIDPVHSPYSLYAKVDGAVSSVLENVITITTVVTGYKLTTGVRPAGVGYVTRSPDRELYVPGETVLITAYRSVNYYYFDFWSGDASGTWGQIWVVMDRDKSVTANFKSTPYA